MKRFLLSAFAFWFGLAPSLAQQFPIQGGAVHVSVYCNGTNWIVL
jgi:hypothetical protein